MKKTITKQVLEYLVVPKTYRQIKDALAIKSDNTLDHALKSLRASGCVERMAVDNPLKGLYPNAKHKTFAYKANGVAYAPTTSGPTENPVPVPEDDRQTLIDRINLLENEARRLRVRLTIMDARGDT